MRGSGGERGNLMIITIMKITSTGIPFVLYTICLSLSPIDDQEPLLISTKLHMLPVIEPCFCKEKAK